MRSSCFMVMRWLGYSVKNYEHYCFDYYELFLVVKRKWRWFSGKVGKVSRSCRANAFPRPLLVPVTKIANSLGEIFIFS